jgi:hypothetical protein
MSNKTHPGIVTYHETEFTFLPVTVVSGDQSTKFNFAAIFNPIPYFFKWLEDIIDGNDYCFVTFDEEGPHTNLILERSCGEAKLTIDHFESACSFPLEVNVDPLQLVGEFYLKLLEYRSSSLYIPENWEQEGYTDSLTENRSEVVESWLTKNSKVLTLESARLKWR